MTRNRVAAAVCRQVRRQLRLWPRNWRRTVTTGATPATGGYGTCLRSTEALGVSLTLSSRMTKA